MEKRGEWKVIIVSSYQTVLAIKHIRYAFGLAAIADLIYWVRRVTVEVRRKLTIAN
jgi:hypothetical protein